MWFLSFHVKCFGWRKDLCVWIFSNKKGSWAGCCKTCTWATNRRAERWSFCYHSGSTFIMVINVFLICWFLMYSVGNLWTMCCYIDWFCGSWMVLWYLLFLCVLNLLSFLQDLSQCKTIINNYSNKLKLKGTNYTTVSVGHGMLTSSLFIRGKHYKGGEAWTKRKGEQLAAQVAIRSLLGNCSLIMSFS